MAALFTDEKFTDEKFILRNILILSSLSYIFLSVIQDSAELNSHSIVFLKISSTCVVYYHIYGFSIGSNVLLSPLLSR